MKIIELDCVDSTNEYCKRLTGCENAVVTAKRQTAGKGTKGRSFVSDDGGLYLSVLRTLKHFDAKDAFKIMVNGCVAVCRTAEAFGLKPVVRWANDVLVGGKKICGTLIENQFFSDGSCRSITGIGLNVNNRLPEELRGTATSLCAETGKQTDLGRVTRILIRNLGETYTVDDYRRYLPWLGQPVTLFTDGKTVPAVALGVEEDGRLRCEICGETKKISSAEVSLRL